MSIVAEFLVSRQGLSDIIYREKYEGTILKQHVMFNVYSTTLARYKYGYWTEDGIYIDGYFDEKWLLDPYDPIGCNKGTGIKIVCNYYGDAIGDVITIGDSENDIPFLKT